MRDSQCLIVTTEEKSLKHAASTPSINEIKKIHKGHHHLPSKGYVFVFERETRNYRLSISRDKKLRLFKKQRGPDDKEEENIISTFDDAYFNSKDIASSTVGLIPRFIEVGLHYLLLYSRDELSQYIYLIVSMEREIAELWAKKLHIEIEIHPTNCVKKGREDKTFLLAERTYLNENSNESKYITDSTGRKHQKLSVSHWKSMHIPFEACLKDIFKREMDDSFGCINNRLYLRILYGILEEDIELGGCNVMIARYLHDFKHPLIAFFALHDRFKECINTLDSTTNVIPNKHKLQRDLDEFSEFVSNIKPKTNARRKQKEYLKNHKSWIHRINDIRSYYGEAIGFYFAFLAHYQRCLYPMTLIGIIWFIVQVSCGDIAVRGSSVIVFIAICWSTIVIETWYRREWTLQYQWGMLHMEQSEIPRSTFDGDYVISTNTGILVETHKSKCLYYCRILLSLLFMIFCMIIVVIAVIAIRETRKQYGAEMIYSVAFGVLNAIQIQIMNAVYTKFAFWLNEFEGHRLEIEYYNHLVIKRILFIIFNSFNSLYFIAFWDPFDSDKLRLEALRIQLVTLFLSAIFLQNTTEVLVPKLITGIKHKIHSCCIQARTKHKMNVYAKRKKNALLKSTVDSHTELPVYIRTTCQVDNDNDDDTFSPSDELVDMNNFNREYNIKTKYDATLLNILYNDIENQLNRPSSPDVLDNCAEIVVLHGYIMLFVVVFPLMPLLCVLNNYFEMRVDFYNLITAQRPIPHASDGMGVWKVVLNVFNVCAILTNMALLTWDTPLITDLVGHNERYLLLVFFVSTMIMLFCIIVVRDSIPDQTYEIQDAILRQEECQRHFIKIQQDYMNKHHSVIVKSERKRPQFSSTMNVVIQRKVVV